MTVREIVTISGILIEGVDYSGKTTACHTLVRRYRDAGICARYSKDFLSQGSSILTAVDHATRMAFGLEQDLILADATALDVLEYQAEDCVLVQDRHWLSMVGHLTFFYGDRATSICERLRRHHLSFACHVYLTSTLETKRARIAACPPRSELDRLLADDPLLHQRYDEHCLAQIPPREDWLVIDTSSLTQADVANAIERRVQAVPGLTMAGTRAT